MMPTVYEQCCEVAPGLEWTTINRFGVWHDFHQFGLTLQVSERSASVQTDDGCKWFSWEGPPSESIPAALEWLAVELRSMLSTVEGAMPATIKIPITASNDSTVAVMDYDPDTDKYWGEP